MDVIQLLDDALVSLKDFQRETVKSVMESFTSGESQRVLVADEVGLGKTIVAKGIIAELLKKKLQTHTSDETIKPLRITYICSNLTLANENRKKLAVFKGEAQIKYVMEPTFSRLLETALVEKVHNDDGKLLEVCSLTPSTSFNLTQGDGNWRERMIVLCALLAHPDLSDKRVKLRNFWQGQITDKSWWCQTHNDFLISRNLHESILFEFHRLLDCEPSEKEKQFCKLDFNGSWKELLQAHLTGIIKLQYPKRVRACIRVLMARACSMSISADLFILDEFQRFKGLLDTKVENEESIIAREIFNNKNQAKVLLLSATPFKALSRAEDDEDGNAHAEELSFLLRFISDSDDLMLINYDLHRKALQQQILKLKDVTFDINSLTDIHKVAIEKILKNYICRTERVQISENYEGLFSADVSDDIERLKEFSSKDIEVFKALDHLGLGLQEAYKGRHAGQLMEFYKAAPWPLSFLSGYQFKLQLDKYKQHSSVKRPLKKSAPAWLSRESIQKYQVSLENAPHAKTRSLVKKLFRTASEEMLWVPPTLPHYPLVGCFENQQEFSKTLLFSSWAMVPRALSGLISYEAERRLLVNRKGAEKAYFKEPHNPKIKFDATSSMVGWSLVYPAKVFLDMPLKNRSVPLAELLIQRTVIFSEYLKKLTCHEQGSRSGDRWFALAPMLLDEMAGYKTYINKWREGQQQSISRLKENKGIRIQFDTLCRYLDSDENLALGPMPEELAEYLAYLSVAGPAVSIARTWQRNWTESDGLSVTEDEVALAATEASFAVVAMFNKPESESILNKRYHKHKYFKAIVHYCADGGFQAVIDEFGHLLKDAGFPMQSCNSSENYSATARLAEVLGIKTSSVACQFWENKKQTSDQTITKAEKSRNKHTLRCHYAVPLGNQKTSDEKGLQRVSNIRDAFNSPFRPFMLNSTSIGQEGLDFHWYCHNVVHWNLPGNPIDIEQREGRVNRYKSLVVRKRLAEGYQHEVVYDGRDPWLQLFNKADEITSNNGRYSDLVPYWHLPKGKSKIERFVPMMPMSKDVKKLEHALKVLAMYRLAFGQPRQEELIDNLLNRKFSIKEEELIKKQLIINLSPMLHNKK